MIQLQRHRLKLFIIFEAGVRVGPAKAALLESEHDAMQPVSCHRSSEASARRQSLMTSGHPNAAGARPPDVRPIHWARRKDVRDAHPDYRALAP
jgi:hypothetical protein